MTKRIFFGTIIIIWGIVLIQLRPTFSIFLDNCISFFSSLPVFTFTFSFSHFIILSALSVLLYFVYEFDDKERLNIFMRYWLTLKDVDSLGIKMLLLMILAIIFFTAKVLWNGQIIPEIFIVIIFFTILEFFQFSKEVTEFLKKRKLSKSSRKNKETSKPFNLFTDEPIGNYSDLNDFQKIEVRNLKNIIQISEKEYLSIALNGSWGSGKTSILKGLKNLLEKGSKEENIEKGNCEVFELNLWQARTPENAISELENLFAELFNKVYLNVSTHDLAFFSLLAESVNSGLSSQLNKWVGENDTIPTSRKRIEQKLNQVLSHLKKKKLVILIDDLDRIPDQYLNGFLKIICYVTGLENVVTISGINREKIIKQLGKQEDISIWADGISAMKKYAQEKNIKDKWENTEVLKRDSIIALESPEKKEFRFTLFDNDAFLSKIFNVQRELISSKYHIKEFKNEKKGRIENFQDLIFFKDKNEITKGINNFIESNSTCFNSYRDLKLFLNEVFIYLIGFGGNKQKELKLSDYIGIDFILAMSWAKVVSPDFYKKIQDYVSPFMYQEQYENNGENNQSSFNLEVFTGNQYQYCHSGKEHTIQTPAHLQIKRIFDLRNEGNHINEEEAIRYFRPIIEPYEFTYEEFIDFFNEKYNDEISIIDFINTKWDLNPSFVFNDYTKRLIQREFILSERLNSALALMYFKFKHDQTSASKTELEKGKDWNSIMPLFQNSTFMKTALRYDIVKDKFDSVNLYSKIFQLWEKKTNLNIDDIGSIQENYDNKHYIFYSFFNPSDFTEDTDEEILKNYKFLLGKIKEHKFERSENGIRCLLYTYDLANRFWRGKGKITPFIQLKEIVPTFLNSFFSIFKIHPNIPEDVLKNNILISDAISNSADEMLFDTQNLEILIHLFEIDTTFFIYFKDRLVSRGETCKLPVEQRKIAFKLLSSFVNNYSGFYGLGYENDLAIFFKIRERSN